MKISIIIPTLNEEKYIGKLLSALKPQLEKDDEIIIVDSYSRDKTVEIAKKFGVKIFYIKRCGIGPAKTFGTKQAKNEIIAMLDADSVPAENWVNIIKKHLKKETINAVAGLGLYEGEDELREFIYNSFSRSVFEIGKLNYTINKVPWMPVNNCAIRKRIFFKYDGLQNVVCEDLDFAQRAKGLVGVVYDEKLKVILSNRRFKNEGFLKTVWTWTKSDIAIISNGNKILATKYNVVR